MTDPQVPIEQVREVLEWGVLFVTSKQEGKRFHTAHKALDQLSALIAEQEKAVRVEVLEKLKLSLREKWKDWREMQIDVIEDDVIKLIDQKIEEAKK